jgi:hypothetical protein
MDVFDVPFHTVDAAYVMLCGAPWGKTAELWW